MGNPDHLKELLKGVAHWNAWREAQGEQFRPDLEGLDIRQAFLDAGIVRKNERTPLGEVNLKWADLRRSDLGRADLRSANLRRADLRGADLRRADLRGTYLGEAILMLAKLWEAYLGEADLGRADLSGADLRRADLGEADFSGAVLERADLREAVFRGADLGEAKLARAVVKTVFLSSAIGGNDGGTFEDRVYRTDLSLARNLTQEQLKVMDGDSETLIPEEFKRPEDWVEFQSDERNAGSLPKEENPEPTNNPSPVGFTPPVEFATEGNRINVRHFPTPAKPRRASSTPIDQDRCAAVRKSLVDGFGSLAKNLRKYTKEDPSISNRVQPAEALLTYVDDLRRALKADLFLPTLFQDYVEIIGQGFDEERHAFESGDRSAVSRLVKRAREHYACYPELPEINDPGHTSRITEDFPMTVGQLEATLADIVHSAEGLEIFSDTTREKIDTEKVAYPPANTDPDKSKQVRYGAILGEMWREMSPRLEEMRKSADAGATRAIAWMKTYSKVDKAWEAVRDFLGTLGGGGA